MTRLPPKAPKGPGGHVERRVAGPAPKIGEVNALVPGSAEEGEPRRRRRRYHHRPRRREPGSLARLLLLLLGIAVCAVASVLLWQSNRGEAVPPPSPTAETPGSVRRPDAETLLAAVERLLGDPSAPTVASLMRPGEMDAGEAAQFLARCIEDEKLGEQEPVWLGSVPSLDRPIEAVALRTPSSVPRFILVTPDPQGRWQVDFDAFARRCEPPLRSLGDPATREAMVRVLMQKGNHYGGAFDRRSEWDCYRLQSPDLDAPVHAYARAESVQARALSKIHQRAKARLLDPTGPEGQPRLPAEREATSRVTLRLSRPEGAETGQFAVESVLADDWVLTDEPVERKLAADPGSGVPEDTP